MRLAFVSAMVGYPWGGCEELWSQAAGRLHDEGYQVTASVARWPTLPPKIAALVEKGVRVSLRRGRFDGLLGKIRFKLTSVSRTERADKIRYLRRQAGALVVISQGGYSDGLEWMKASRDLDLPYVAIVHSNSEAWWPEDDQIPELTDAYRAAKRVYYVSRRNLQLLEDQLGEDLPNAEVVWNPCNVDFGNPPAWPAVNGTWKVAQVGQLHPPTKGQDLLLRALARPQWSNRPVEVIFFGEGSSEGGLRRLAEKLKLKNVMFRGHVNDIRRVWEKNHLLVMPSRQEGLPLALVEAFRCERPAVATDVGDTAELVVDGETGFVAPAPTVSFVAEALERAWERRQEWQPMGQAARARAERLIPQDPVGNFCDRLLQIAQHG